ncbi:hypothetical protein ARMGADRAFT_143892 [Armillaria gallica]|uniref:Uncharacterized protein n=1 Tax=Armillaria gallica TaxID=47427 RepID=A0A2H3DND2_ARMGA|nr:hypothetical protein ARMGADRAFT_143892 [Armillaria gallica]
MLLSLQLSVAFTPLLRSIHIRSPYQHGSHGKMSRPSMFEGWYVNHVATLQLSSSTFLIASVRTSLRRFTKVGRPSVPVSAGEIPLSISSESRGRLYFEDLLDMVLVLVVVGRKEVG